jgi:hypothetical protein
MSKLVRDHLRSNVVGYVAVFIALSGTAYAVDGPLPGQNTVGSLDIINGEVGNVDLAPNSVGSPKIADASVKNADLSIGASSSNTIADGGIQGIDIKNDTVTGLQINESTLDGVARSTKFDFRANAGESGTFSIGGFGMSFNCHTSRDLQWFYTSGFDNATLHMSWSIAGDPSAKTFVNDDVDSGFFFDPFPSSGNDDDLAGNLVYSRPDGGVVTMDFQMEDSDASGSSEALGGTKDCLFSGIAHFIQ